MLASPSSSKAKKRHRQAAAAADEGGGARPKRRGGINSEAAEKARTAICERAADGAAFLRIEGGNEMGTMAFCAATAAIFSQTIAFVQDILRAYVKGPTSQVRENLLRSVPLTLLRELCPLRCDSKFACYDPDLFARVWQGDGYCALHGDCGRDRRASVSGRDLDAATR